MTGVFRQIQLFFDFLPLGALPWGNAVRAGRRGVPTRANAERGCVDDAKLVIHGSDGRFSDVTTRLRGDGRAGRFGAARRRLW